MRFGDAPLCDWCQQPILGYFKKVDHKVFHPDCETDYRAWCRKLMDEEQKKMRRYCAKAKKL